MGPSKTTSGRRPVNSLQAFFNGLGIFGPLFFLLTTWWLHHYLRMKEAQVQLAKVLGEAPLESADEVLPTLAQAVARLEAILDKMHGISGQLPSWGLVGTAAGVFFVLARSSGLGEVEPGELMTFLLDGGLAVALVSTFAGQLNYLILNALYTWRDGEEVLRLLVLAEKVGPERIPDALRLAGHRAPALKTASMHYGGHRSLDAHSDTADEEHWDLQLDDDGPSLRQTQKMMAKSSLGGGL